MQLQTRSSARGLRAAKRLVNGACAGILALAAATALLAQTGQRGYNQIYSFGTAPVELTGLTGTGNTLYGATQTGGTNGMGSVYSLTKPAALGEPWTYTTLYNFGSRALDGSAPWGVALGDVSGDLPVLYGTTEYGGQRGMGAIFCLVPPSAPGGEWTESLLFSFSGANGEMPMAPLVADLRTGELPVLYGTTAQGGSDGSGVIFSLTPPATAGGAWTENVLQSFVAGGTEGQVPNAVVLGRGTGGAPVLYGFTEMGGTLGGGVVFSLTGSGGTWAYSDIYNLPESAVVSSGGPLTLGSDGVLYGASLLARPPDGAGALSGEVYSLTPPASPAGSWTVNTLYAFGAFKGDGSNPIAVVMGSDGTLYGTTSDGGLGYGTVYSLTPPASPGGAWTENQLYRFPGDAIGGPRSLIIGPHGSLYGTTDQLGPGVVSVVYAIEP